MSLHSTVKDLLGNAGIKGERVVDLFCRVFYFLQYKPDELVEACAENGIKRFYAECITNIKECEDPAVKIDFKTFMAGYRNVKDIAAIPDPPNIQPTHDYQAKNWRKEAAYWVEMHPDAYVLLMRYAQQLKARQRRFGINLLRERLRWDAVYDYGDDRYKFCNTISPYIARLMIDQDPELGDLIECRQTKW